VRHQDLYGRELKSKPLAEILDTMRKRDLAVRPVASAGAPKFSISFTYPDKYKAQKVVEWLSGDVESAYRELSMKLPDPEVKSIVQMGAGGNITLLDPADLPSHPTSPNPKMLGAAGATTGLICGILVLWIRRLQSSKLLVAG
jgi:hypothetical protein